MLESIQKNLMWQAVLVAGLAAGTAFLAANLLLMPILLDINGTLTLRYAGALVLGSEAITQAGNTPLIVGVGVHYALSILFTLVIAIVVHRWGLLVGLIGGAVLGLSFYSINFYTMTRFFEWFAPLDSTVLLIAHITFGIVAGGVYELLDTFDEGLNRGGGV